VTSTRLALTRGQILAFRQRAGGLIERLPHGAGSLRQAAWAGLQRARPVRQPLDEPAGPLPEGQDLAPRDRKSTRLNSSHQR